MDNRNISVSSTTAVISLNEAFLNGPTDDINKLNTALNATKIGLEYVFNCSKLPTQNGNQLYLCSFAALLKTLTSFKIRIKFCCIIRI